MKYILILMSVCIFTATNVKTAETGYIKSLNDQVRDLVFADLSRSSHEDLVVFGQTSKSNDIYLRSTAERRKFYLFPFLSSEKHFFKWHAYGSMGDCKRIVADALSSTTQKALIIERIELCDNGKIRECYGSWDNFDRELSHKPTPFYNENKHLCFIGFGWLRIEGYRVCGNVLYYEASTSINTSFSSTKCNESDRLSCLLKFCDENGSITYQPLMLIWDFPYLLKAILNSPCIKENLQESKPNGFSGDYLLFNLENITLPHNYTELVPCEDLISTRHSFKELPFDLQQALAKQYEKTSKNIRY